MSTQKAFAFDVNRCTGCSACQVACSIENGVDTGITWRGIHTFNPRHLPGVPTFHHSMACNHCVDPPCMKHCPALAYSKDTRTGAVTIDAQKCIGCKYCSWACPYDAPRFNRSTGTMEKCTFCAHRLADGLEPACVAMCPTGALQFEDHRPSNGGEIPGFTATEIGPAIRFEPLRKWSGEAVARDSVRPASVALSGDDVPGRIGPRSEWTLLAFSLLAALVVGRFAAALVGTSPSTLEPAGRIQPWLIPVLGGGAMALSTRHLGRWRRSWRAVLNWRRSWLSREVLLFSAFVLVSSLTVILDPSGPGGVAGWCSAALGFASLLAVDNVYAVTRARSWRWHSARVTLTALLFAGLFAANVALFGLVAVAKSLLYLWRKYDYYTRGRVTRPWYSRARVLVGLVAPLLVWRLGEPAWYPVAVAAVFAGELIDRVEFYLELEAPSPAGQMRADLEALLQKKGSS